MMTRLIASILATICVTTPSHPSDAYTNQNDATQGEGGITFTFEDVVPEIPGLVAWLYGNGDYYGYAVLGELHWDGTEGEVSPFRECVEYSLLVCGGTAEVCYIYFRGSDGTCFMCCKDGHEDCEHCPEIPDPQTD